MRAAAVLDRRHPIPPTGTSSRDNLGGSGGIYAQSGGTATIRGNYIGTDASGSLALPNGFGVNCSLASVVVGGSGAGEGNLISGNAGRHRARRLHVFDDPGQPHRHRRHGHGGPRKPRRRDRRVGLLGRHDRRPRGRRRQHDRFQRQRAAVGLRGPGDRNRQPGSASAAIGSTATCPWASTSARTTTAPSARRPTTTPRPTTSRTTRSSRRWTTAPRRPSTPRSTASPRRRTTSTSTPTPPASPTRRRSTRDRTSRERPR